VVVEAQTQGLKWSDEALTERIVQDPSFQSGGRFIGRDAYLKILAENALSPQAFENDLRRNILREKLRTLLTDGVLASPAEVEGEYRRRNEKAELEYVLVPQSEHEEEDVSEEEISSYFEDNSQRYRFPLQRKIHYVSITPQPFQSTVSVTEREIERYYNQNLYLYESPEQVQASHILFKTEADNDDEVRARAERVLAQVRAGGDFAELAREHSEDTSAERGGDLGSFGRGEMVPEFEEVAFSLEEGDVSDLVKTAYGYHIIKVTGHQPPLTRPLESVKEEIRSQLAREKARDKMEEAVEHAALNLSRTGSLQVLVQDYNLLRLQETPFFGRQDPVPQLGGSPDLRRMIFELPISEVSPPVRVGEAYIFFQVLEEKPPRIPALEEVEERVRRDLARDKAMDLALARAKELRARLATAKNTAAAARAAGVELKTTENFFRGTQLPEAGRSPAVQEAAFSLAPGVFSDPLPCQNGYVLLRVVERSGYSVAKFASEKDRFTEAFLNEKRQRVWAEYLRELQHRYSVQIDRENLRQLLG
ncbi:MAG: peptidyl-prolyl cis-trans isomerase, partial [Acidobacteriota bacterium]